MKYGELMAGLRKGSPGHLYLLAGEESYFIEKAKERLLQCFFPTGYQKEDVQVLEEGASLSEIMEAVETVAGSAGQFRGAVHRYTGSSPPSYRRK